MMDSQNKNNENLFFFDNKKNFISLVNKKKWLLKEFFFYFFQILFKTSKIFFAIFIIYLFFFNNLENKNDKKTVFWIFTGILIFFFLINLIYIFILLLINYLRMRNFKYNLEEKFIVFEEGIINKKKRHVPYSVIQNVSLNNDIIDKFLKITNLIIENAAGSSLEIEKDFLPYKKFLIFNSFEIGFNNNQIIIPGLDLKKAEKLKSFILKKTKENLLMTSVDI